MRREPSTARSAAARNLSATSRNSVPESVLLPIQAHLCVDDCMASAIDGENHLPNGKDVSHSVYNASSLEDIRSALTELSHRESRVTSRLDTLLASQEDLKRQLGRLDLARAQLSSQVTATRTIGHGMLAGAAATASRISSAVRGLDREQAAVRSTLDVVEQVSELKSCVLGVHGSMGAPQDWERAAQYLHRASQIPRHVIEGAFAEQIVPTAEVPDPPRRTLDAASESLCSLFLREFERATKDGDGAAVTRFFKLFPLIGRNNVGLEAYGRYVCSGIASRARTSMSSLQRKDGMFYAHALTKLFEHIAQIVDGHEGLVERHYGVGSMTKVIERIQVEADVQGGLILDTWADERGINRKLTDVKSYPFNFLAQSFMPSARNSGDKQRSGSPAPANGRDSGDEGVDMKDVDAVLTETALMLSRWALYARFIASKTGQSNDDGIDDDLLVPAFITHSSLQRKVTDLLIDPFNTLATFFFRRSVEKSFQLDEPPTGLTLTINKALGSNPPFITSAVDDVMYIVSQVIQRSLATSQRTAASSVITSVGRVLGGDFFSMIQRKMRDESYPKPAIQGAMPPESIIISFLVLLNNLDVSIDYVRRIIDSSLTANPPKQQTGADPDPPLSSNFPFGNDAFFMAKSLTDMESSFRAKTIELITEAVDVVQKQVMRPRLRPVLAEAFRDIDYSITSEKEAHGEDNDSTDGIVTQRFEKGWQIFTIPIKRLLTPANYDKLIAATIAYLARTLEKRIWALYGRVNELGAVQLERDITGIVTAAVKGARYELRDVFARCVQMALIVNMEEDEWDEISKLDGLQLERESGVEWKLDSAERKRCRGIVKNR